MTRDEAANKFAVSYDQGTCDGIAQDCFIAGAEWQARQLLQGAPMPEDTVLFNKGVAEGRRQMMDEWLKDRDGCFWDGVNEGKEAMREQMLKDAVEGEICMRYSGSLCATSIFPCLDEAKFKLGDKVKLIIVKEP